MKSIRTNHKPIYRSLTVAALLVRCVSFSKIVGLLALCLLVTVPALGQYELSWSTVDGGGGRF